MSVEAFVRCAKSQIGKPYRWATAGPESFDCSGLVAYCVRQATGQTISRGSHDQWRLGISVGPRPQPGDLMFYGNADHVGIAVGDGKAVHALNEQRGVIEASIDANYGLPFLGLRRLLFDGMPAPTPQPTTPAPTPPKKPKKPKREKRKKRKP